MQKAARSHRGKEQGPGRDKQAKEGHLQLKE